ncbi:MAG: T9SS type A sorting domain-containing protein, partial [Bacteroidota bacterium]
PDGATATTSGVYVSHISNAAGCDSTITTNLTVIPNSTSTQTVSICDGATHTLPDGATATVTGTYVSHISNAAGCDSIVTTLLTVLTGATSVQNVSICDGSTFILPDGASVTSSGTYISTIPLGVGCDSVITTNLTVISNSASSQSVSICDGTTHILPDGTAAGVSGIYFSHILNASGCDSVITTDLTVIPNTSSSQNISICAGSTYTLPDGIVVSSSGTYISHTESNSGCDSVVTSIVTVLSNSTSSQVASICAGQTFNLPDGSTANTSGIYTSHILNTIGCDSTITTTLTVIQNTSSTHNVTICNGASYTLSDGTIVSTAGVYVTHLLNSNGCDSTITTNVSVSATTYSSAAATICSGHTYTLPDGNLVSLAGTYISIIPSSSGCDSVITTTLSVITNTTSSRSVVLCAASALLMPDNTTIYPIVSGSFITTLPNANYLGCDSIVTTNVTVRALPTLITNVTQIRCFGGTASVALTPTGGTAPYTFNNQSTNGLVEGSYLYTLTDANGCVDSVDVIIDPAPAQLNLTATANQILCFNGRGSVTLTATGGTAPYIYGGSPRTNLTAGTYNYTVTDFKGCTKSASAIITPGPTRVTGTMVTTPTGCVANTGTAKVTPGGGRPPYTFSWNTNPVQTTNMAVGLSAGTYVVTVTDSNGCTLNVTAVVANPSLPRVIVTGNLSYCPDSSTNLCATGSMSSYLWSNGDTTQCSRISVAGTYTVRVTNAAGCTASVSVNVTQSTLPMSSISGNDFICPGGATTLTASPGFTYKWNTASTKQFISVRTGGTYTVTVKNSAGCTSTATRVVSAPMKASVRGYAGNCANGYQGSAVTTIIGGVAPFTYLWNTGQTTSSISGLRAGAYNVRVTDARGCMSVLSTTIAVTKSAADYSRIVASFNNNDIAIGRTIWFSAVVKVNYTGGYPLMLTFSDQNIASSRFNLNPKISKLVITDTVTVATTTFNGIEWMTIAPPNISGNYFISGYAHLLPSTILRNLSSITWKGVWTANRPGVTNVEWKWSAAVYSSFNTDMNQLGVKSADGDTTTIYANNDPAGSPENYKLYTVAGARGTGIGDYVGSYSGPVTRIPCTDVNFGIGGNRLSDEQEEEKDNSAFIVNAYPNPFNSKTTIEFMSPDFSGMTSVEIYSMSGVKIASLFNGTIEAGSSYNVEFNAGELPVGIYLYRISNNSKVINGRLILVK